MQVKSVKIKLKDGEIISFDNATIHNEEGTSVIRFDGGAFSVAEENIMWIRVWL